MTGKPNRAPAAAGGELSGLLRKAEALHRELQRAEAELRGVEVKGEDAAEQVQVKLTADGASATVRLLGGHWEGAEARRIEEACEQAIQVAVGRLLELRRSRLGEVSRGLDLPGLFD